MSLLYGDALRGGSAAETLHDGGFDVANKQLRHGQSVLSVIAFVNSRRAGAPGFVLGSFAVRKDGSPLMYSSRRSSTLV